MDTYVSTYAVSAKSAPNNLEAEQAVLGSILISSGEALAEVRPILGATGEAFYREAHGWIYETCVGLWQRAKPVDFIVLVDELEKRGLLDRVGGPSFLTTLISDVPTAVHAEHYAHIVADAYAYRRFTLAAGEVANLAYSEELTPKELEARVRDIVNDAAKPLGQGVSRRVDGSTVVELLLQEQAELVARGGKTDGLVVGIGTLDEKLHPLEPGDLMFVLAPTSTGKTTLALMMLKANALREHRPVYYFNELSSRRLRNRLVTMESVDWESFRRGSVPIPMPAVGVEELRRGTDSASLMDALESLNRWIGRCILVPAHGMSANEIVEDFRLLWQQGRCDQVIVDYLDLVAHRATTRNDSDAIGEKLMVLKNGAAACRGPRGDGLPIVVMGQPPKEFSEENRPTLNSSFGSVRPSQYAGKFLTMWRERGADGSLTGYTLIRIEKNPDDGNEGSEVACRVAGTLERRGFTFYPLVNRARL